MHFPGMAPALSVVASESRQDRRGSNARCFGKPPSTREAHLLCLSRGDVHLCWGLVGSVGTAQGPLPMDLLSPSPALAWGARPGSAACPGLGPGLLTPHLLFLVKNSPEARQRGRGAEVSALSLAARRSVPSRHGGSAGRGEGRVCSTLPYSSKTEGQDRARERRARGGAAGLHTH